VKLWANRLRSRSVALLYQGLYQGTASAVPTGRLEIMGFSPRTQWLIHNLAKCKAAGAKAPGTRPAGGTAEAVP